MREVYYLLFLALIHQVSAAVLGNKYYRPTGIEVSGFANSTAAYHRSPCPALNVLANHGYLARDGKGIQTKDVKEKMMEIFNFDDVLATSVTKHLPTGKFTLADLGVHNFLERDASLVHDDAYFGEDPSHVNQEKLADLLSRAGPDELLTTQILGQVRRDREWESKWTNPTFDLTQDQVISAYQNAVALVAVFGNRENATISVAHATSFLLHEKFPSDWTKNANTSTVADLTSAALQILTARLATTS